METAVFLIGWFLAALWVQSNNLPLLLGVTTTICTSKQETGHNLFSALPFTFIFYCSNSDTDRSQCIISSSCAFVYTKMWNEKYLTVYFISFSVNLVLCLSLLVIVIFFFFGSYQNPCFYWAYNKNLSTEQFFIWITFMVVEWGQDLCKKVKIRYRKDKSYSWCSLNTKL